MLKEKIKILGDRFKFYKPEAVNMLSPINKEYVITEENIEELLNSFNENPDIFVYGKHKGNSDEERVALGKIVALRKLLNEIGLEADIDFNEDGIEVVDNASKSPSVELVGELIDSEDDVVYLSKLKLTGVALVELPASEGVPIVASAVLQLNGGINMDDKKTLDELVAEFETTGEVSNEMLDMIKEDVEMLKLIIAKALGSKTEEVKAEDSTTEDTEETTTEITTGDTTEETTSNEDVVKEDEEKKEELSLSAWERAVNKAAEKKGYMKGNVVSVENSFAEAKQMYRAGFNLSRIVNLLDKDGKISFLGKIESKAKTIDLSAVKREDAINEIAKLFR